MKKIYIYWAVGLVVVYFLYTSAQKTQAQQQAQLAANQGSDFVDELEGAGLAAGIGVASDYLYENF